MKKLRMYATMLVFLLTTTITTIHAAANDDKDSKKERTTELTEAQKARLEEINSRVSEIKAMDKSSMSASERKALRKELREMKKEAKTVSGGVYLSIGAIIIIILLLILLI